jgi:hypothetical protein
LHLYFLPPLQRVAGQDKAANQHTMVNKMVVLVGVKAELAAARVG